jgi:hypothetical protein
MQSLYCEPRAFWQLHVPSGPLVGKIQKLIMQQTSTALEQRVYNACRQLAFWIKRKFRLELHSEGHTTMSVFVVLHTPIHLQPQTSHQGHIRQLQHQSFRSSDPNYSACIIMLQCILEPIQNRIQEAIMFSKSSSVL